MTRGRQGLRFLQSTGTGAMEDLGRLGGAERGRDEQRQQT
jgi:hypothetical protein